MIDILSIFIVWAGLSFIGIIYLIFILRKIYYNRNKLISDIIEKDNQIKELSNQKRSLETIYGNAVENLTPFIEEFKDLDPKEFRQLGRPIDFIYFGHDKIIIIEVKSGNAKLNSVQRNIRDLVKDGKVEFREVRIKR